MTKYLSGAWRVALIAALLLGAARVGQAAVVNYSESVGGDLEGTATNFTFDVGVNTISGTTGFTGSPGSFDSFMFTVPVGTELVAGQVQLTDALGNVISVIWDFNGGGGLQTLGGASPGTHLLSFTPLGAGSGQVGNSIIGTMGADPNTADYTFTFTLRAVNGTVPEPATLALLAFGLAGLGFARRRRQR